MKKVWNNYKTIIDVASNFPILSQEVEEIKEWQEKWYNVKVAINKLKDKVENIINAK